MKKILLALRYGSPKTKITLISIALLLLSGGALLVYGLSGRALVPLGVGAFLLIGGLLMMMSISFAEKEPGNEKETEEQQPDASTGIGENINKQGVPVSREKAGYVPEWQNDMIVEGIVENGEPGVDVDDSLFTEVGSRDAQIEETVSSTRVEKKNGKDEEPSEEDGEETDKPKKKKKKKDKKNKSDASEETPEDEEEEEQEEDEVSSSDESYWDTDKPVERRSVIEAVVPTPKQLRERRKLLKVKGGNKKNTPIFIDECKRISAVKTPAYVQVKGKTVSIILVEKALRTVTMPLNRFTRVTYEKNVEEKHMEEYEELKKEKELYDIFGEMMPNFYAGTSRMGTPGQFHNRYVLGGSIAVTPRSIRKLMKVFDLDFHVFDSLDIRGRYSDYFKMAYENRIFWTDNCITQTEYQNRIRSLLQTMVDDKKLINYDFNEELNLMVRYKLITREYADYYLARKNDKIKIRL